MSIENNLDSLEALESSIPAELITNSVVDSNMLEMLGYGVMAINILSIVFYLLFAWGLYMINKKFGEKYAWMSWIPLLQIYSLATAAGKSMMKYIIWPIVFVIIAGILLGVLAAAIGEVGGMIGGLLIFISYIYLIVRSIQLYHAISLRTGRGVWTTIGFIFISFIMFPVVGYKLKNKNSEENL